MEHGTRDRQHAQRPETVSLGELLHQHVRVAVEQAVQEELAALLGDTTPDAPRIAVPTTAAGPIHCLTRTSRRAATRRCTAPPRPYRVRL